MSARPAPPRRVVISGGGIAGCALAVLLGQAGHAVAVIERNPETRWKNGADILKPAGIETVRAMGLLDRLAEVGAIRRETLEVYFDRERVSTVDYRDGHAAFPYFLNLPRERLLRLLLEVASELPTVAFHDNRSLSAVERRGGAFRRVTLDDGTVLGADLLVGADGINSAVREAMGIGGERTAYAAPLVYGDLPLDDAVAEQNRLYCDADGGMAYYYPVAPGRTRLVLSFPRGELKTLKADASGEAARARLARLTGAPNAGTAATLENLDGFRHAPVFRFNAERYARGNAVLVGDAAHLIHPITGQGMNLALEDVGALGAILLEGPWGADDVAPLLARYEARRRPLNEKVVGYGDRMATSFHDRERLLAVIDPRTQSSGRRHLATASR